MFDVDPTLSIADQAQRQSAAAMQYAQLNPMQQATYNDSVANATVAAGVGELGRVGMAAAQGQSAETPQQKMAAVKAQISQALQGKDMTDPEQVYPVIIQTLQAAGLTPQAMAAVQEFETIKRNRATDARADRTQARLEAKDAATAAFNEKKLDAMKPTSKLALDIAAYSKALAARDAQPEGSPERATAQKAVDAFEDKLTRAHKIVAEDAGDRIVYTDQETGQVVREVMKGIDPTSKYRTENQKKAADALASSATAIEGLDLIAEARRIAGGATGSILGTGRDMFMRAFGVTTPEGASAAQLKVLAGVLLSKFERLPGPVSDFEMKTYNQANGNLADTTLPSGDKLAALETMEKLFRARLARSGGSAPATTPAAAPAAAPVSAPASAPGLPAGVTVRRRG